MRTFQRIFIRRGVRLRHSEGFHPHPILSFALPLPVGQVSACELLDFELTGGPGPEGLAESLAPYCPEGIRPIRCREAVRPVGELSRLRCWVELLYDGGVPEDAPAGIKSLLTGESVVIEKRTKHKDLAQVDIRPMLHSLSVEERPGAVVLNAVVSAQNPGLNPALLAAAVEKYLPEWKPDFVRAGRLEFLDAHGSRFF